MHEQDLQDLQGHACQDGHAYQDDQVSLIVPLPGLSFRCPGAVVASATVLVHQKLASC